MLKCVGVQVDHCLRTYVFLEGSLEVKLVTIWTDENRDGKSQRKEEKKRRSKKRKSEERRSRRMKK